MNREQNHNNTDWAMHGIQYAIFKRISPGLTHDMVGPLSVALIQAGIIKRKLKADNHQASELLENAVNLENHIKQTVLLIRAMKSWDAPNNPIFDVGNVYRQCIKFFQTRLTMRGIDLRLIDSDHENTPIGNFQAFLYSWLALLCYLEDSLDMPTELHIQQLDQNSISVSIQHTTISPSQVGEGQNRIDSPSEQPIGQQELSMLSGYYSTQFEFNDSCILFKW